MRRASVGVLEVSVVGLGCNNFGRTLDAEPSAAVVHAALEAGITYFDTADSYGDGRSERFLAAALGRTSDDVVIATKFGRPVSDVGGEGGARPEYVRRALEGSLRRLDRSYVDLYQLHIPDPATPIAETLGTLSELKREGMVREIGCTNFDASELGHAVEASLAGNLVGFVSDQVEYSLVHRDPERTGLLAACRQRGVALLPYYPLASGILTGKVRRGRPLVGRLTTDRYRGMLDERSLQIGEAVVSFAVDRGVTPVQVAIGWLLDRKEVPSVTPGATSPLQVMENASASEWAPSSDDLEVLDAITDP